MVCAAVLATAGSIMSRAPMSRWPDFGKNGCGKVPIQCATLQKALSFKPGQRLSDRCRGTPKCWASSSMLSRALGAVGR